MFTVTTVKTLLSIAVICWGMELELSNLLLAPHLSLVLQTKAIRRFVITEKAPTRVFSGLKAATAFTFKNLLRNYAKQALSHAKASRHEIAKPSP